MPFMILRRIKDNPRSDWRPVTPEIFATQSDADAWKTTRETTGPAHLEYTVVEVPA